MKKLSLKQRIIQHERQFKMAKGIVLITPAKNGKIDPCAIALSTSLHLLVRTKYLFLATLKESYSKNTYSGFVLVRSFFETCMALGYLCIKVEKMSKNGDMEGIGKLAFRMLQGGKHFPEEEFLKETGKEIVPAINIYDYFDEVDKDLGKLKKTGKGSYGSHREVYDSVLSEFGHPNFLGLNTCSFVEKPPGGAAREVINLSKSSKLGDKSGYLNYLDWGSTIFFHYWDKLHTMFKKQGIELISLK